MARAQPFLMILAGFTELRVLLGTQHLLQCGIVFFMWRFISCALADRAWILLCRRSDVLMAQAWPKKRQVRNEQKRPPHGDSNVRGRKVRSRGPVNWVLQRSC